MDDACAVCAEPLEWVAYGACGHREVCSTCVARFRFILRDHRCCLCMSPCPVVFATKAMGDRTRAICDFSALPANAGEGKSGDYWHHEGTQTFFDDADHYRAVGAMCRISCTVCEGSAKKGKKGGKKSNAKRESKFGSIEQLKTHLCNQHRLYMCDLCLEGRKVFTCEQKNYTGPQLNHHIKTGDSEVDGSGVERSGFVGHPVCECCKRTFYGENELYTHMTREHFSCHICQRQHSGRDDYFNNYDDLEIHFREAHFLCENEGCLEKKFIVFKSKADLKRHNDVEHRERISHAPKNAALQTPSSCSDRSEQEQRNGRGRRHVRPMGAIDNASLPVQTGIAAPLRSLSISSSRGQLSGGQISGTNSVVQQSYFSPLSLQEVPNARRGSVLQEASSPSVSEQSTYAPALYRSSRSTTRIELESFPPLSGASNRSATSTQQGQRKFPNNTHASGLPQHSKGTVNVRHSVQPSSKPSDSSASPGWSMSTPSSAISGKLSEASLGLASGGNEKQESLVISQMLRSVEDVRAANKSLVEKMLTALGMDRDRYTTFKEISGEYLQGVIDASKYLSHVEQFGLSHLVLEMARMLPDPQKQKELADAYYANLRRTSLQGNGGGGTVTSKESNWKNKGKGKVPDVTMGAKDSSEDKSKNNAGKLQSQRGDFGVLIRDGCGAADGSSLELQSGWPVMGVWQSRGGGRLFLRNSK